MIKESTLKTHKLLVDEWFVNGLNGTHTYLNRLQELKQVLTTNLN